jgi:hypothetical protein
MTHLSHLLVSKRPHVFFILETQNSNITKTAIKNHFNLSDAFVFPSQGQSGGFWLMWNDEINVTIIDHHHHYIFARSMC